METTVRLFARARRFASSRATRTYELTESATGGNYAYGYLVRRDGRRVGKSLVYLPNVTDAWFALVSDQD